MEELIKCIGCGIEVQTEDKKKPGFAPASALKREHVICQRCFRLKHYNEIQDVSLTDDDFLKILNGIGQAEGLIVKIVDIFDFNGSWLPGLPRFVGNKKILLVGNKVDLLPKSVNQQKLTNWMRHLSKEMGMKPDDVFLISSVKGQGVRELASAIEELRDGKDVYIVGCTNVGKSTFINRLIKDLSGEEQELITTSHYPGTTLDMIEIPLDDGSVLYDTPGIINHHQMAHFVDEEGLRVIQPRKEIKPKVYQLNEKQTLFFGGLARFDFIQGERTSFICHLSNDIHIHRTKLEKADELYQNHLGELLQPPGEEAAADFPELVRHEFSIKEEKMDIVFSGLGWVTINEPKKVIAAYAPKGVGVSLRKSLI